MLFADSDLQRARLLEVLASQPADLPPLRALQAAVLTVAAVTTALRVSTELWVEGDGTGDLPALLTATLDRLRAGLER